PIVSDGLLDDPSSHVLLGGGSLNTNPNPGFRLTADYAVNERWGLEGSFLYTPSRSTSQSVSSSGKLGSTDLLIPFFDATLQQDNVTTLSFAPIFRGAAKEELSNNLLGAEAGGTFALAKGQSYRVDLLGGFRWLRLHETYTVTTSSPFILPTPVDIWNTTDKF